MVNYLYDLDEIERNHEAFVNRGADRRLERGEEACSGRPVASARGFARRLGRERLSGARLRFPPSVRGIGNPVESDDARAEARRNRADPDYDDAMTTTAEEIAAIRIELVDTDPPIWREVEVPTSLSLETLHAVIQAAFGWRNYHLWEFSLGRRRYGPPSDDDWREEPLVDAGKVRLADCLVRARPKSITCTTLATAGSIA